MTLQEFIDEKPVTNSDLFGEWHLHGGSKNVTSEAITKILQKYMLPHLKKAIRRKEFDASSFLKMEVKFKRDKASGKIGETMQIYNDNGEVVMKVIQNGDGFTFDNNNSVAKKQKTSKHSKKDIVKHEVLTAKEIQDAIPFEERKGWTNYDLLEKMMAEDAEREVKYWDTHDKRGKLLSDKK